MVWLGSTYFDFSIIMCNFNRLNIDAIVCCAAATAATAIQKAASSNCNSESDSRKSH
jgi:hypothetical protein